MNDRIRAEEAASAWIAKQGGADWTSEEAAAFRGWLESSASHRAAYFRLNAAWQEAGHLRALPRAAGAVPGRNRVHSAAGIRRFAIAASLAAVALATLLFIAFADETYSTGVGGLRVVRIADGSVITLNTGTAVEVSLRRSERRVRLERGEAFFEVAKDAKRLFIVEAGDKRIIAVGTAFSVRREGADLEALVAEGTVRAEVPGEVVRDAGSFPAGSMLQIRRGELHVERRPQTEIEKILSWRKGFLTLADVPLKEAIAELNRYNKRQIVIVDPSLSGMQVGGVVRLGNQEAFIRLLEEAFPIRAEIADDVIRLGVPPP